MAKKSLSLGCSLHLAGFAAVDGTHGTITCVAKMQPSTLPMISYATAGRSHVLEARHDPVPIVRNVRAAATFPALPVRR